MSDLRLAAVLAKRAIFVQHPIGEGRFGTVYEVQCVKIKSKMAAKVFDLERLPKNYRNGKLSKEIEIHESLDHENIIGLKSVISLNSYTILLLDLADQTLKDVIGNRPIPEEFIRRMFRQCISGLTYLHDLNIAHRDLKPDNILLIASTVKISDFGMAMRCRDSQTGEQILAGDHCGSPSYAAPEVWKKQPYNGITADVWSLGIVLYEVLTSELPTMPWNQHLQPSFESDLMNLALSLLESDVTKRPSTAREIKQSNSTEHSHILQELPSTGVNRD